MTNERARMLELLKYAFYFVLGILTEKGYTAELVAVAILTMIVLYVWDVLAKKEAE